MCFIAYALFNKYNASINLTSVALIYIKYLAMVYNHYIMVVISQEKEEDLDGATALFMVMWVTLIYLFYSTFLCTDWFWHQILGLPAFIISSLIEDIYVIDPILDTKSEGRDLWYFFMFLMGYLFAIMTIHYHVQYNEIRLFLNFEEVD